MVLISNDHVYSEHLQSRHKDRKAKAETNLSIDALGGHTLSADAVAGAVDSRSLHPAAAQRKLLQPLRVSCIASFCGQRRERFDCL